MASTANGLIETYLMCLKSTGMELLLLSELLTKLLALVIDKHWIMKYTNNYGSIK